MVDIPKFLEDIAKEKKERVLEQILILLATNQRSMDQKEFEKFLKKLTDGVSGQDITTFNRDKMEELRMLTNLGANKSR